MKFQEDVEEGKRWSKPYVPSLQLSTLLTLKKSFQEGLIALNVEGRNIDEIIDELMIIGEDQGFEDMQGEQFDALKIVLGHRVKLRMKLDMFRKVSSVAAGAASGTTVTRRPAVAAAAVFQHQGSLSSESTNRAKTAIVMTNNQLERDITNSAAAGFNESRQTSRESLVEGEEEGEDQNEKCYSKENDNAGSIGDGDPPGKKMTVTLKGISLGCSHKAFFIFDGEQIAIVMGALSTGEQIAIVMGALSTSKKETVAL